MCGISEPFRFKNTFIEQGHILFFSTDYLDLFTVQHRIVTAVRTIPAEKPAFFTGQFSFVIVS